VFSDLKCEVKGNVLWLNSATPLKQLFEYSITFSVSNPSIVAKSDVKLVSLSKGAPTAYHV